MTGYADDSNGRHGDRVMDPRARELANQIADKDGKPRVDTCPACATPRSELVVAPGRFYCHGCGVAGEGPNDLAPAGAQLALEVGRGS